MVKCCLCGKEIEVTSFGWKEGNNALPLKDGRCCDLCNSTKVIPARIKKLPFWNRYEWDLIDDEEFEK